MRHHAPACAASSDSSSNSFGRQPDLLPVALDAEALAIDDEAAAHERRRWRAGRVGAPERRADARQQLVGSKRLGDVVVGAGVEGAHLVGLAPARREHHDRQDDRPRTLAHTSTPSMSGSRGPAPSVPASRRRARQRGRAAGRRRTS
jgi:hypothetical protein